MTMILVRSAQEERARYFMRDERDEKALLIHARALDQDALAVIHETYYAAMYRYISFRVDDLHTVQDLTSEVFTRFIAALRKRLGQPRSIGPWLYGTASRVVKEYYRDRKRWDLVAIDESMAAEQMGLDESLDQAWARRELHEAIQELTEDQQTVLALRFGGGLHIREVARLIKKSEGAAKMLQARAISALASRMVERK